MHSSKESIASSQLSLFFTKETKVFVTAAHGFFHPGFPKIFQVIFFSEQNMLPKK